LISCGPSARYDTESFSSHSTVFQKRGFLISSLRPSSKMPKFGAKKEGEFVLRLHFSLLQALNGFDVL